MPKDTKGLEYVKEKMPQIGLGTYLIKKNDELRDAVETALECGYRFIDTAQVYRNEAFVGRAVTDFLPKFGLDRSQVFITSKLDPKNNGDKAYEHVKKSVQALDIDYIDLFLIHWPGKNSIKLDNPANKKYRQLAWEGLEKAYDEGLVKAIGVSNYQPRHLDELMEHARIHPAVNQCEFHPAYCPQDVLDSCKQHDIIFQAYSSFGSTGNTDLLQHKPYAALADKYKCTVPQLLLAWALCQGFSVLPKSTNANHICANFESLKVKLSDEDIETMKWTEQKKFCWDPKSVA